MIIPPGENIIETKRCRISWQEFFVTDKDIVLYEKLGIPSPTLCPQELNRNIFAYRQEWNLFSRPCSETHQPFLSCYRENTIFPVYNHKLWWSDDWSAWEYGRKFHFEKPFFEQYKALQDVVPRVGTTVFNSENCEYNGHARNSKNCYLSAVFTGCESIYYSYWIQWKNIFNSSVCNECENIGNCLDMNRSFSCFSCQECLDCRGCYFSYQLKNCQNCIACSGLVAKQYHVYNKPVTQEEYVKTLNLIQSSQSLWDKAQSVFEKIRDESPRPWSRLINVENSTGDHLLNCRDCFDCFDGWGSENNRHIISFWDVKDCTWCYSLGFPVSDMCTHTCVILDVHNTAYSFYIFNSQDLLYCDSCRNSSDMFGCIGINHGKYVILNTSYSKQEYETLRTRIIDHMKSTREWGEFFPLSACPYPYNDTAAMDFYPLSEPEVISRWGAWAVPIKSKNVPNTSDAPLHIFQYDEKKVGKEVAQKNIETLLASIFRCPITGEPFQIIRQELVFHLENSIPLPMIHPKERHRELMKLRNPRELFERSCTECHKKIMTTYTPERPEKVVCEECYRKLVY